MEKRKKISFVVIFKSLLDKLRAFHLSVENHWIGGVCAGIAYQFKIPPWAVRLFFFGGGICLSHFDSKRVGGLFFVLYILLWIFVPDYETEPKDFDKVTKGIKKT